MMRNAIISVAIIAVLAILGSIAYKVINRDVNEEIEKQSMDVSPKESKDQSEMLVANKLMPEDVIQADVIAQNDHNQATFLSIRTSKEGVPENKLDLKRLWERYPQCNALKNIVSAKLVGIKPLPLNLVASLTNIAKYLDLYSKLKVYYVAIDYRFKKERRHLYNGVNYRLYVLGLEEDRWVIVEASEPPVYRLIEAGYSFGTPEERIAARIQEERIRSGRFTNVEGKAIEAKSCVEID